MRRIFVAGRFRFDLEAGLAERPERASVDAEVVEVESRTHRAMGFTLRTDDDE